MKETYLQNSSRLRRMEALKYDTDHKTVYGGYKQFVTIRCRFKVIKTCKKRK